MIAQSFAAGKCVNLQCTAAPVFPQCYFLTPLLRTPYINHAVLPAQLSRVIAAYALATGHACCHSMNMNDATAVLTLARNDVILLFSRKNGKILTFTSLISHKCKC